MITWIFFEEGEEETPEFEIITEFNDFEKVYDIAYESYGPQVEDLMYKIK